MLIGAAALLSLLGDEAAGAGSSPYLVAFGAVAPRFAAPPPSPVAEVTADNAGVRPDLDVVDGSEPTRANETEAIHEQLPGAAKPNETTPVASDEPPPPPRIIPDDTRPRVRAEDILPYFRFPSAAASQSDAGSSLQSLPSLPMPSSIPPSSATYRLQ